MSFVLKSPRNIFGSFWPTDHTIIQMLKTHGTETCIKIEVEFKDPDNFTASEGLWATIVWFDLETKTIKAQIKTHPNFTHYHQLTAGATITVEFENLYNIHWQ